MVVVNLFGVDVLKKPETTKVREMLAQFRGFSNTELDVREITWDQYMQLLGEEAQYQVQLPVVVVDILLPDIKPPDVIDTCTAFDGAGHRLIRS
jgi:hypothetical protein